MIKKLHIASDHAGFELKKNIISYYNDIEFVDYGTRSSESCDYPDYIHLIAKYISDNPNELGIIICGSANGVSMVANKHKNVRAAICWNDKITELARLHNKANLCALPARFISIEEAIRFINIFINTEFEGDRHLRRVNKINI